MKKHMKPPKKSATQIDLEKLKSKKLCELERLLSSTDPSAVADALVNLKGLVLVKQIERLQVGIDRERGLVHDKEKCCASLTQIFSAESRELHNLGRRILAQFPEAPKGTVAAIDKEVDLMLERLKNGPAYKGQYFCPHCQKLIDEFRLEPLPEDQQPAPATVAEQPTKDANV